MYLDLASEALNGGPQKLVHPFWSPLYPAIVSLALFAFQPTPAQELLLVHFVNFVIFVMALLCLTFFIRAWLASGQDTCLAGEGEKGNIIVPFAFSIFLYFTTRFIGFSLLSPDLCVAGVVFLVAGITCRISLISSSWREYVLLGAALALGYYAKTVMFPVALLLFSILFIWPPKPARDRVKVLASLIVFLVLAAPLIALISNRLGRLSIGEAGRLNYAWHVNRLQPNFDDAPWQFDWTYGVPQHPPRRLVEEPVTLEFAAPVAGTYPLWFDPVYWNAGATVHFRLAEQWSAVKRNLRVYRYIAESSPTGILVMGALVLCIFRARSRIPFTADRKSLWLGLWSIIVGGMYALVHVEFRYVDAFLVLFWVSLYVVLGSKVITAARTAVFGMVICTMFVSGAMDTLRETRRAIQERKQPNQEDYILLGEALRALRVGPGDQLAVVGNPNDPEPFYARYVGGAYCRADSQSK